MIIKKARLPFLIFSFFVIFLSPLSVSAFGPVTQPAGLDPRTVEKNCKTTGAAFDADCLCDRDMCRLSAVGAISANNSGSNNNRQGKGRYTCFPGGAQLVKGNPYFDLFRSYRGFNYLPNKIDPNDPASQCPNGKDMATKFESAMPKAGGGPNETYEHSIHREPNEQGPGGEPRICFSFAYLGLSGNVGALKISEGDLSVTTPFQNRLDENPAQAWSLAMALTAPTLSPLRIIQPPIPNGDSGITEMGNPGSHIFKICTSNYEHMLIPVVGYSGYNTSGSGNGCAPFVVFADFRNQTILGSTSTLPAYQVQEIGVESSDISWLPSLPGKNYINDKPVLSDDTILQSFYTDAMSRLPTAQNVPIGAKCVVKKRNGLSYSFWQLPQELYFPNGGVDTICQGKVLFTSKDLFGDDVGGTPTAFGCLPNSFNGAITFVLRIAIAISAGVTLLIISINVIKIMSNSSNADAIAEGKKKIVGVLLTFVGLIGALTILNILGLQILGIGDIGGGLLRVFTGG